MAILLPSELKAKTEEIFTIDETAARCCRIGTGCAMTLAQTCFLEGAQPSLCCLFSSTGLTLSFIGCGSAGMYMSVKLTELAADTGIEGVTQENATQQFVPLLAAVIKKLPAAEKNEVTKKIEQISTARWDSIVQIAGLGVLIQPRTLQTDISFIDRWILGYSPFACGSAVGGAFTRFKLTNLLKLLKEE